MANEKRVRANLVGGALDAGLVTTGTSMSSPGLADLPVVDSTNHAAITLFTRNSDGRYTAKEIVYVTAHSSSATTATIARGQEGTSDPGTTWASGTKWVHSTTKRDLPSSWARSQRTAGSITTSNATITDVDSALDLVLPAQAGDQIEYRVDGLALAPLTKDILLDISTWVSGAHVAYFGPGLASGASGMAASYVGPNNQTTGVSFTAAKTLTSSDISAGTVTLRIRYISSGGGATIYAIAGLPFVVMARNLGPETS